MIVIFLVIICFALIVIKMVKEKNIYLLIITHSSISNIKYRRMSCVIQKQIFLYFGSLINLIEL